MWMVPSWRGAIGTQQRAVLIVTLVHRGLFATPALETAASALGRKDCSMNRTHTWFAGSFFAFLSLGACAPSGTVVHTVPAAATKSADTLAAEGAAAAAIEREDEEKLQAANARAVLIRQTAVNDTASGVSFLLIPAGTFTMGCTDGDAACTDNEKPAHPVTISRSFYMAFTLTTNYQYQRCVDAGVCHGKADLAKRANPVVNVDWNDARDFCGWAQGRLPSEAEWEYAARGGIEGWRYPWGNEAGEDNANFADTGGRSIEFVSVEVNTFAAELLGLTYPYGETSPVGTFTPNGFGLDDMAGNVLQWTANWRGTYTSDSATDPAGPPAGAAHVLRGGSWIVTGKGGRVSMRYAATPTIARNNIGFRCARDVAPP
jgi:formylglycine-generating enzyme required for sulfatase activity